MKNHIWFIAALGMFITQALAVPVSEETARVVAVNWYSHFAPAEIDAGEIAVTGMFPFSTGPVVDCYLYAFKPAGFVIVSGDDATIPVIGYSNDSPVQAELTHPAVREYFDNIQT